MSFSNCGLLPEVVGLQQNQLGSSHRSTRPAYVQGGVSRSKGTRSPQRARQQRRRRKLTTDVIQITSHDSLSSEIFVSPRYSESSEQLLPEQLYRLCDPAAAVFFPEDVDGGSLDNRELDKLMSNIGKNKSIWKRVLQLHEWLVSINHKPDNRLCTTLIRLCSQHGQSLTAMAIYDWMRENQQEGGAGLSCSVYTYTAAMRAALGGCLLDRALSVWDDCVASGCEPDARLCTVYIEVCSRLNRTQDALHMYKTMLDAPKNAAMAPTVHAFTTAMRAATEGGRWDKSLEIWHDMEMYGCAATGHAYAAAISACAAGSQWVPAVQLFEDMISNDIKPDVVSCTALITALATHGEYERAEKVVEWMLNTGVTPNVRTYTALVTAMGNAKQWQKAVCVIHNMENPEYGSVTPNAYTYSALLKSLGEHGQWALAEQVFQELEKSQIDYLMEAASQQGHHIKSSEFQNRDGDSNKDLLWSNAVAQAIMGQAILQDPTLLQNPDILQSLHNLQANSSSCDLVSSIPGVDQFDLYELAGKRRNSPVNEVVCGALMLAYERSGKWEEAVGVIGRAKNIGIPPNNVMFNTAMSAAGKASRLDVARELYEQIEQPDAVTYETLIAAYGTAGDIENAEYIFGQMVRSGYKARDYAYCGLIAAYSVAGDLKNAVRVRTRMQTATAPLTVHVYNALIAACQHCKDYQKALDIFGEMRQTNIEPNKVTMELVQGGGNKDGNNQQQMVTAALSVMGALGNPSIAASLL